MAAPKIGDRRAGEGVGKFNAAHVSAAQIRPLERIVRKHPALGDVHLRAQQQRFGVYYALTGKTAAVEDIHAHLAAKHTVWLKSAASGENACKIGRNGRGQRCAHARMYDAVPGGDKSALAVEHRQVHRMQHCADKLAHRAGRGHGVAVEGEDIARRAQKLSVAAARVQLALIAAHELCKLQQRAALALKAGGAEEVVSIDSSADALQMAQENAKRNGFDDGSMKWIEANVFEALREFRDKGEQFDLVILDPPKFASSHHHVDKAARAYKDINLNGLRILAPGGQLLTFSCSGAIDVDLFQKIVAGAVIDSRVEAWMMARLGAGIDHPLLMTHPEGEYLKGLYLLSRGRV